MLLPVIKTMRDPSSLTWRDTLNPPWQVLHEASRFCGGQMISPVEPVSDRWASNSLHVVLLPHIGIQQALISNKLILDDLSLLPFFCKDLFEIFDLLDFI